MAKLSKEEKVSLNALIKISKAFEGDIRVLWGWFLKEEFFKTELLKRGKKCQKIIQSFLKKKIAGL